MATHPLQSGALPRALDCPACKKAKGLDHVGYDALDPVPEPVRVQGQPPQGLCGWCGGSGKLSSRVFRLYDEALAELQAQLAQKMITEPEK